MKITRRKGGEKAAFTLGDMKPGQVGQYVSNIPVGGVLQKRVFIVTDRQGRLIDAPYSRYAPRPHGEPARVVVLLHNGQRTMCPVSMPVELLDAELVINEAE